MEMALVPVGNQSMGSSDMPSSENRFQFQK